MKRVIVGLSGGVDSAAAAYLMKLSGCEVIGVTLKTWVAADGRDSRCCEIDDARAIASRLDIPYYAVNCTAEFTRCVTKPFVSEYLYGRTPNPCIVCNPLIKWTKLLEVADNLNADCIVTGHYAEVVKLESGRFTLAQAEHLEKDQTYMLYRLSQQQLSRTFMPLSKLSKPEVRRLAESAGIPVANKPDSQEICFIPDNDHIGYIEENADCELPPEGDFVDTEGNVLGRHKGIYRYTIGQRKGLGISLGERAFVREIDPENDRVVLGSNQSLFTSEVYCDELAFMGIPPLAEGEKLECMAKIRYQHKPQKALAEMADGRLRITFEQPVRAATPGQSAVLYDDERRILCGGFITR